MYTQALLMLWSRCVAVNREVSTGPWNLNRHYFFLSFFFFYQERDVTDVIAVFCGPFVSFTLHYNVCRQQRKVNAVLCAL